MEKMDRCEAARADVSVVFRRKANMKDKRMAMSYAWGFRAGAALTLLLAVTNVVVGVYTGISSPIWSGLAFAVAAVAVFLSSVVTRDWLFVYIVALVVLAVIMGFLVAVAVLMSPGVLV
jgi:hypothetical protein